MNTKFAGEIQRVALLLGRLGIGVDEWRDPNASQKHESGIDVVAVVQGRTIGVQVTDVDTGDFAGEAGRAEMALAKAAHRDGKTTYAGWGQNDPDKLVEAFARAIARKSTHSQSWEFDEVWLLITAGIPQHGRVVSTMVFTPWVSVDALDSATLPALGRSGYARAFFLPILSVEDALYEWRRNGQWQKSVAPSRPEDRGLSMDEVLRDPEWLADPHGKALREAARAVEELRARQWFWMHLQPATGNQG